MEVQWNIGMEMALKHVRTVSEIAHQVNRNKIPWKSGEFLLHFTRFLPPLFKQDME